jgi:UDP-N-acetyl-D-glucosamine dehydrogenase
MSYQTISIIGLGYVGLPLAMAFAEKGIKVIGIDKDASKINMLCSGKSYVEDVLDEELKRNSKCFHPTTDYSILSHSDLDAMIICVPTPLSKTKDPDISYIISASREVANYLRPGVLVVMESTTYPGTTEEVLRVTFEAKGLKVGQDFYLAFSPERIDPGNKEYTLKNTPKVVGGVTKECTRRATKLYQIISERVVPVSSASSAEAVKLLENTFRAINIGLANEFAQLCNRMGLDVWEIIDAASTKPFGFMPFYPGPGIGGHCIPVDPLYLSWKAKLFNFRTRFIELADEINSKMPEYVVYRVFEVLNELGKSIRGSRILILGVSYKKDVGDVRESPNLEVMRLLLEKGAEVVYHDPYVPEFSHLETLWRSVELNNGLIEEADCVVILTGHSVYDWESVARNAKLLLDTRNVMNGISSEKIHKL